MIRLTMVGPSSKLCLLPEPASKTVRERSKRLPEGDSLRSFTRPEYIATSAATVLTASTGGLTVDGAGQPEVLARKNEPRLWAACPKLHSSKEASCLCFRVSPVPASQGAF